MLRVRPALLALAVLVSCDGSSIKTASGERIEGIVIQERFATTDAVYTSELRGERLRKAAELMDKHGLFALEGTFEATGILDTSTVTVSVSLADKKERRLSMKDCKEERFCAFAGEAKSAGILRRLPMVCKSEKPCSKR